MLWSASVSACLGVLFDITRLQTVFRQVIGDVTFKEAYDRTNRILNITVTQDAQFGDSSRILNFLTSPNVLIWSAACASCALRFLYEPYQLMERYHDGSIRVYAPGQQFTDGSVEGDLPMQVSLTLARWCTLSVSLSLARAVLVN
jgi:TAG lipase / steryl ester hydrolase / phospholipase A2 / LPA acyltransferase